jgi:predicted site-specific integrase-resolvase
MAELTPKKLSERIGIPAGTLARWRSQGIGPIYRKHEGTIRYDERDVEEWRRQCQVMPSVRASVEERIGNLS